MISWKSSRTGQFRQNEESSVLENNAYFVNFANYSMRHLILCNIQTLLLVINIEFVLLNTQDMWTIKHKYRKYNINIENIT